MKTTIIQLQTDKFIMPNRLTYLIRKFAKPIAYKYGYVSNTNSQSKLIYYKETKQFPNIIEVDDLAENERSAEEMKIAFENMCKGSMYDTMKKELDEARLQIKDLQSNMVEKVNTDTK